jgi:ABC-type branched-subunit amino acid transport system substrate-binding protein
MKRFQLAVAALCASALVLAGCGNEASGGDGNVAAPADLPEFTGEPVKVGVIGPFDKAAFGNPQPELRAAAFAAMDGINKRGGINGHELEVIACDDEYDPNKSAECARKFVEEGVVAVVGSQTIGYSAYGPIVKKAGIPVIGSMPLGSEDYQDLNNYPISTGGVGLFAGDVIAAKMAGKKSVYMVGLSMSGGEGQAKLVGGIAKSVGVDFKGYGALPADSSDLSPAVRAAEQTGAEVVIMAMDKVSARQFMVASQSLGADYTLAHSPDVLTPDTIAAAPEAAEGMILSSPFPPYDDPSFPGLVQFNEEMDDRESRGDKHAGKDNRQTVLNTWVGFHAFEKLVDGIEGEVTAKSLQQALETAKDIDLGVGVTWSPSVRNHPHFKALSNFSSYFSTVKDGKIVLTSKEPVNVLGG